MAAITLVLGVGAVCVILALAARLLRMEARLREMEEMLSEIGEGRGNRRLLAKPNDPTAPVAYRINQIVSGYEDQLGIMRRNDEMNRQLMTSLSHDVRTPLTTLIGYLDAVCRGLVSGREREDYIRIADKKAHDLKAYVDVLFDWFKLNSGEFHFSMEPVEMAELTRECLKDWIPVLEEHGLDYDISIPDAPHMAQLDADAYRRVLSNLIQNVVDHSHASCIGVSLEASDRQISISVFDDGVGISQSDLTRIFDRLYKCDMGRSEKGSGLGLSIAKQLVEEMDGSISVESELGVGTKFTVRLSSLASVSAPLS